VVGGLIHGDGGSLRDRIRCFLRMVGTDRRRTSTYHEFRVPSLPAALNEDGPDSVRTLVDPIPIRFIARLDQNVPTRIVEDLRGCPREMIAPIAGLSLP